MIHKIKVNETNHTFSTHVKVLEQDNEHFYLQWIKPYGIRFMADKKEFTLTRVL